MHPAIARAGRVHETELGRFEQKSGESSRVWAGCPFFRNKGRTTFERVILTRGDVVALIRISIASLASIFGSLRRNFTLSTQGVKGSVPSSFLWGTDSSVG